MMPPRQRGPMPRQPFGGGGRMMQGMRGPSGPPSGPSNFTSPLMRRGGGGPSSNAGGGLLSKLLGGAKGGAAATNSGARSAAASGGILKSLANPASINGFLANSQKFLNTASQVGPMINQYGPMVRNIPVMWKMFKGLKGSTDTAEETVNSNEVKVEENTTENKKSATNNHPVSIENKEFEFDLEETTEQESSIPKPKLFI